MKKISILVLLCLSLFFTSCQSNKLTGEDLKDKKIVFLGDSITNAGLYVSYIENHLIQNGLNGDIISVGLSSETASGLSEKTHPFPRPCIHSRLDNVLKVTRPDIVVACYGMNDGIYHPQSAERLQAYKDGILKLINTCEKAGAKVILMTPPPFDALPVKKRTVDISAADFSYRKPYVKYNDVLADYALWLKTLDYTVIDLNTSLMNFLDKQRVENPKFSFGRDGIHPDSAGHLLMAYNFLSALGFEIDQDGLLDEVKRLARDPQFMLVHKRRTMRSKGWLDYIGYKRGRSVKSDSVEDIEKKCRDMLIDIVKLKGN